MLVEIEAEVIDAIQTCKNKGTQIESSGRDIVRAYLTSYLGGTCHHPWQAQDQVYRLRRRVGLSGPRCGETTAHVWRLSVFPIEAWSSITQAHHD